MLKFPATLGRLCALALLALLAACSRAPDAPPKLRILCGSSMSTPIQEIGKTFADANHVELEYDFGGSETLLPKVLAGSDADVFVCHDPFEAKLAEAKRGAGSVMVGYLQPVLVTKPGNPKGLRKLADLGQPDLRLGIGNPSYSTCGEMFVAMLDGQGLKDAVMARVVMQARTHTELANGVTIGSLDAAVIWNFAAAMYGEKLQVVPLDVKYAPVRVTVCGLTASANPTLRDRYLEYCRSAAVQAAFRTHGYTSDTSPAIAP